MACLFKIPRKQPIMTRLKQTLFLAVSATVAVGAIAFAEVKDKMDAAALAVGASAPAYSLPDQNGKTHALTEDRGKVVLMAFYPKDFTGGCTLEAHSLTAAYPDLKALGVTVYGVSVQDADSHKSFCSKEGIPYTLLADTDKKLTTAYGDLIPGVGIANRVTDIIGADGKVAYVDKNVNGHLTTCGADWVAWIKAHPEVKQVSGAERAQSENTARLASYELPATSLRVWRSIETADTGGSPSPGVAIGKSAYSFTLPDAATAAQTSVTSLAENKKATVLMFISTRCPVSNAYNERMVALAKKYQTQDVAFVGIDANTTEPATEVASFAKDKGFPFPVLKDAADKVANAYDAHVTPETYVINSKGLVVYHGRIDNDQDPASATTHELADALDATLAGKPVARAQTKAFGCSIKRG